MFKNSESSSYDESVILSGYQKKLKTMKKKFFVLHKETATNAARLEYYDNERKFRSGLSPKRVIKLKNCFNINRRLDTKHDFVIALSTKDSGFGIVLDSEQEMYKWLEKLITLQRKGTETSESQSPQYDHVWQVKIRKQGIAEEKGIVGNYYVCLSSKSITLMRIGNARTSFVDARLLKVELALTTIRRCGDTQCLFYMEVGRQSSIGPGELWMETDDNLIAQNMHSMILSAMSARTESNMEPMRKRSSSANEASKPINVLHRRQQPSENLSNNSPQSAKFFGRERCDSLPTRNRTSSECSSQSLSMPTQQSVRNSTIGILHSACLRHSNSPPMGSVTGYSESEESSISIDDYEDNSNIPNYRFNPRQSDGVIPEENTDDLVITENRFQDERNKGTFTNTESTETYTSMTPLNVTKEDADTRILSYQSSGNNRNSSLTNDIDFNEFLGDESESQLEKPIRCYSIGSRADQINKPKQCGQIQNDSVDHAYQQRVRAFSVGSKAKIPRCDLQRGILISKISADHKQLSNNNVLLTSNSLNKISNPEKKSTSAPILIHKSHNSVDCMGDLMEIDFSKSPLALTTSPHLKSQKAQLFMQGPKYHQLSKSVPSRSSNDNNIKCADSLAYVNKNMDSGKTSLSQLSVTPMKSTSLTENGYLEMKPVGLSVSTLNENSCIFPGGKEMNEKAILTEMSVMKPKDTKLFTKSNDSKNERLSSIDGNKTRCSKGCNIENSDYNLIKSNDILEYHNRETDKKPVMPLLTVDKMSKNLSDLEVQENDNDKAQLKDANIKTGFHCSNKNEIQMNDDYVNIDKVFREYKYKPSESNTKNSINFTNTKRNNKNLHGNETSIYDVAGNKSSEEKRKNEFLDSNGSELVETGYEILHIKSDSSLQSHKQSNRILGQSRKDSKLQFKMNNFRPNITTPMHTSTLCNCTSSSTSCLNSFAEMKISSSSDTKVQLPGSQISVNQINSLSRPISMSSEHELHYADLDLKQCSSENSCVSGVCLNATAKDPTVSSGECTNVIGSQTCNSYVKIDFDRSDSSSTSSKNFN